MGRTRGPPHSFALRFRRQAYNPAMPGGEEDQRTRLGNRRGVGKPGDQAIVIVVTGIRVVVVVTNAAERSGARSISGIERHPASERRASIPGGRHAADLQQQIARRGLVVKRRTGDIH